VDISTTHHFLKVRLTRREWQRLTFAIQEQLRMLAMRTIVGSYETYLFVAKERWQTVRPFLRLPERRNQPLNNQS